MGVIKRAATALRSDLMSEEDAARRLGLSLNRVRWLLINGHLQRGVTRDRRSGGVTKRSVEMEEAWRRHASLAQRMRRAAGYAFWWMP